MPESEVVVDAVVPTEAEALAATAVKEAEALVASAAAEAVAKEAAAAKDAELPEWARAELTRVRKEAGDARVGLRDAMAKLEGAKSPEEFATAVAEMKAENVALAQDLARTNAGTKYKLPPELAAVLKGNTPEELEAHAKVLSKFVTPEDPDPDSLSGGLDPSGEDGSWDPVVEAQKARANRY